MIKYPYGFKNLSTDSKKYPYKCWQLDTGIPLFFSKIQYLPLYTIPLYTIMRVSDKYWENMLTVTFLSEAILP